MDGDRVKKRSIDELGGSGEKQHKKSKTVADTSGLKQEGKAAQSRPKPRAIKPSSLWNFAVDYNDHFETPSVAYADIAPFLHTMSSALQISEDRLTIFDPYWCEGSVVANLNELGFKSVINRNRDFYADIKKRAIPDYDVLVTNPPYSGEHKVNLLKFLATHVGRKAKGRAQADSVGSSPISNNRAEQDTSLTSGPDTADTPSPFALLLPVYVATKSYWKDFAAQQAAVGRPVFYVLPPDYYEYSHPEGTGKDIPPFYSAWFIGGLSAEHRTRVIEGLRANARKGTAGGAATGGMSGPRRLSFNTLLVAESVDTLVQRGLVVDSKRPNPKQRKKMKQKAASGGK